MNLGIDFGSTYSMLSHYDRKSDTIRAVQTQNGSNYIPSLACCDYSDELITGQQAKDFIAGEPDAVVYRAFKMLLTESELSRLEQMNYTRDCPPRRIAKAFLKQQLLNATTRCRTDRFEQVVICVPQVWNTNSEAMRGKAVLQEICMELKEELELLDRVTVVTEPTAASAYYAYLHRKKNNEPFNDRMLIVDYGGGTLDISLTKVTTVVREDGTAAMEIRVEGETGAGENHGEQVGDGGLAYLDGTVRLALKEAGFDSVPYNGSFIKAVNLFESVLINKTAEIRSKVQLDCANDVSRLEYDDEVLTTLFYRGKKVPVTYSVLYRAYEQIIRPVLTEQLEKVRTEYLEPLGVDPRLAARQLKLALVGGFGQFELVRQQVYDFFHLVRQLEDGGREDAICYGAALIADGVVTLRRCAGASVGLVTRLFEEKNSEFAITRGMELENEKVYCLPEPIVYGGPCPGDWELAIGKGKDRVDTVLPPRAVRDRLNEIEPMKLYTFGFSVDGEENYSLHAIPTDPDGTRHPENAHVVQLGTLAELHANS